MVPDAREFSLRRARESTRLLTFYSVRTGKAEGWKPPIQRKNQLSKPKPAVVSGSTLGKTRDAPGLAWKARSYPCHTVSNWCVFPPEESGLARKLPVHTMMSVWICSSCNDGVRSWTAYRGRTTVRRLWRWIRNCSRCTLIPCPGTPWGDAPFSVLFPGISSPEKASAHPARKDAQEPWTHPPQLVAELHPRFGPPSPHEGKGYIYW